jgi:hypothetical protein
MRTSWKGWPRSGGMFSAFASREMMYGVYLLPMFLSKLRCTTEAVHAKHSSTYAYGVATCKTVDEE